MQRSSGCVKCRNHELLTKWSITWSDTGRASRDLFRESNVGPARLIRKTASGDRSRRTISLLGTVTEESRIADPSDPTHIFSWLLCESYDDKGNVIAYQYKAENSDG